jgi:hypothetical protein
MKHCEFFLLRYVPDAVKDEFVNIGLVLLQRNGEGTEFAEVRFTRDWRRVKCLDPEADLEMLRAMEGQIREELGEPRQRGALLKRLEDSLSNTLQISVSKGCLTADPAQEIESLARMYLESPRRRGMRAEAGRQAILGRMRSAFEQAGVWGLMRKGIAAAKYTHAGDPLRIDCGYRPNGEVRLFQAVSLATDADAAKVLGFSYPQMAAGIEREEKARAELTAIVEDDLEREEEGIAFALAVLEESRIRVAKAEELAGIAERARVELGV